MQKFTFHTHSATYLHAFICVCDCFERACDYECDSVRADIIINHVTVALTVWLTRLSRVTKSVVQNPSRPYVVQNPSRRFNFRQTFACFTTLWSKSSYILYEFDYSSWFWSKAFSFVCFEKRQLIFQTVSFQFSKPQKSLQSCLVLGGFGGAPV